MDFLNFAKEVAVEMRIDLVDADALYIVATKEWYDNINEMEQEQTYYMQCVRTCNGYEVATVDVA